MIPKHSVIIINEQRYVC